MMNAGYSIGGPRGASMGKRWGAALFATGLFLAAGRAEAIDCSALPNPIYGLGGSAQKPLIARIAARLAAQTGGTTVVFQAPGACLGINALLGNTRVMGQASYWNATGMELQCDLPIAGQVVDFANMGNAATTCPGVSALPTDVADITGPVTTWNVIVPVASSQQSISSEALYFVYGFGREGMAAPWIDETQIIRRDANSAVQLFIGLAAGIPVERFRGVDARTNAGSVSLLAMSPSPEAAIGFASGETADANRASVRTLAYQHRGQRCGYTPDSTPTSFDKRNVRDGHYWLWSPTHFFARKGSDGRIANARVRDFVGLFTGETAPPAGVNMLQLQIQNGNIPRCAMNVWREGDLGPLMSYQPTEPCGCFFDQTATGSTTCTACTTNAQCTTGGATGACRNGFCEAR